MIDQEIISAIDAQDELMKMAYAKNEPDLIADEYYSPDAWVVGPDNNTWRGRDDILELYKTVCGAYTWESKREHLIQTSPGTIIEFVVGTIYPTGEGETLVYKLQFIWFLVGGKWKCASQYFSHGTDFKSIV